ncbi:MAG: ATP-binding protein [Candidatus Micrarchaeota archaeon]|nr:ATP-binding protein [Candidatus Micrarchaeota archaeon]
MGWLKICEVDNQSISMRNILVMPPEPPADYLMHDIADSIYIGRTRIFNIPFHWHHKYLTNPHICVVGITGAGKSYFVKTFLVRTSLVWGTNAIIIDWAGEYKDWVASTNGKIVSLGSGNYINLLDLGGMTPNVRIKQIIRSLELLTDIGNYPEQKRLTELAIEKAYLENGFKLSETKQVDQLGRPLKVPTLKDVVRILEEKLAKGDYEFPAELENAIYRLKQFTKEGQDYFARQSTLDLENLTKSGLVDIDLSKLPDEVFRALSALTILQFLKEKMRQEGWAKEKGVKLYIVLDEAWKIAKEENSDAVMIVREGRKYQFGLIVASQNPTDISEAIFSNVGTTFILKIKFEKYLDYLQGTLNFSDFIKEEIRNLGVGQAAVNLAWTVSSDFSQTFIIDHIEGEEPRKEYFIDLGSVLGDDMAQTLAIRKDDLRKRLKLYGVNETQIEEVNSTFDKGNRHMDIVNFVVLLDKFGISRSNITSLLKDLGLDDSTIINIFTKVDYKKLDIMSEEMTQLELDQ